MVISIEVVDGAAEVSLMCFSRSASHAELRSFALIGQGLHLLRSYVGRCDKAVARLQLELAAATAAPAVAVGVECGGGSASSGGGAIGAVLQSSMANE